MNAQNVGNPLGKDIPLLYNRKSTLEKGLTNAENVGNVLHNNLVSFNTKSFTPQKEYMKVLIVGILRAQGPNLFSSNGP
jgi:hypothetical protein